MTMMMMMIMMIKSNNDNTISLSPICMYVFVGGPGCICLNCFYTIFCNIFSI